MVFLIKNIGTEYFIKEQITSVKYDSSNEVVRSTLRFFEQEEENNKESLINELKRGKSAEIKNFDRNKNIKQLKINFRK